MKRSIPFALVLLTLAVAPAGTVHAGGYELGGPGARSLGRGDAEIAGTDSPMALALNPANLSRVDDYRLLGAASVVFADVCMRRELVRNPMAAYRPIPEARADNITVIDGREFLPRVCNNERPSIIPQVLLTLPVAERFTLGLGIIVPVSTQLAGYGNLTEGTIINSAGDEVPTPVRYLLTHQNVIQFFPTIGFGYAPMDELRFGVSFGSGVTIAEFTNYAYSAIAEARNDLHAVDPFVPRVTASVGSTPVTGLDLTFAFTWTANVDDSSSDLTIRVPFLGLNEPISGVGLVSPQTWNVAFGFRYGKPLPGGAVDSIGDRLSTEAWDVELDFIIQGNNRVDAFSVDLPDDAELLGILELPDALDIEHRWKNQYIVRVGGDYNVLPGRLALRAGFSYESDGVTDGYENLDFMPFQRFGLHLGATWRIVERFDLSVAYAHLFQQDIDNVGAGCAGADFPNTNRCVLRALGSQDRNPADEAIANAGQIESAFNILALELAYTF